MEPSSIAKQNTDTSKGPGFEHLYRAHPNYRGDEEWYNWTMVNFEGYGDYPARILCLYQKHDPVIDEATGKITSSGIYIIIHSFELREGTSCERMCNMHETLLCSRWTVESTPKLDGRTYQRGQHPNIPVLQSVAVETMQQQVYIIDESPGLQEQSIGPQFMWTMNDQ
jgi:hypothetical protein